MEDHLGGCMIEGDIGTYAPQIWDRLISDLNLKTVIDVGCGAGHSLKYFIEHGLTGIGVEGWQEAITRSPIQSHIIQHDYTTGPFIPPQEYDLCWSCEFVEHVDEQYCQNFIETFTFAKTLAMTHAVPGQPGYHHVNCQPTEYWVTKLQDIGFILDMEYSLELRRLLIDNETNTWAPNGGHVRNTLLIFRK